MSVRDVEASNCRVMIDRSASVSDKTGDTHRKR